MTSDCSQKVGKLIRIEWDEETKDMRIVLEITDPVFKKRVLHGKDFQDILVFKGKDAMAIASKKEE